jgi:glycosyltransferase involved in cell wall biosynthesis
MAHGVPVVATTHCGRVVEDGVNGYLVPARDPDALAAALRRFVDAPDARLPMVPACLATAARFTVARYADALRAVLPER